MANKNNNYCTFYIARRGETIWNKKVLYQYIYKTPLLYSQSLSQFSGGEIYLKCENLQRTGAYKIRGALHKIHAIKLNELKKGLVVSSSGNFGQGMALACSLKKAKLTVFVPQVTAKVKIKAIEKYGAKVMIKGRHYLEAEDWAKKYAQKYKKLFVSPYNDVEVLKGYGTIAWEILQDLPNFDYFLAPTGAGSIISGCGPILKKKLKYLKIIAVQSINTPTMYDIFYNKNLAEKESLAEGLAGGIEKDSITIKLTQKYASRVLIVSEKSIAKAILWTLKKDHLLIEGAAGVVVALILEKKINLRGKKAVLVLSGGNLDSLPT